MKKGEFVKAVAGGLRNGSHGKGCREDRWCGLSGDGQRGVRGGPVCLAGFRDVHGERAVGASGPQSQNRRNDEGSSEEDRGVQGGADAQGQLVMVIVAKTVVLLMVLAWVSGCGAEDPWAEQVDVGETWRGLVVAREDRCADYDRTDYAYNSRVLEAELVRELGGLYGPYTGRCFRDARETDVEHVIALSEAHDSGMCGRPAAAKARFASDVLNLTLASPQVNRSEKRHFDAAEWLPGEKPLLVCGPDCECAAEIRPHDRQE